MRELPRSGRWSSALDTAASRILPLALNRREQVVYSGSSTSSIFPPASRACKASSAQRRAVRLASQVLPEPGPPRMTSRLHRCASASASKSCSCARPVAVICSLRSMAAGVGTDPPKSRGHGSVFNQSISVLRYTSIWPRRAGPCGNRSRTSLSCPLTLSKRACKPSMASSSALAWSVSIRCKRASSTSWNCFGSRSAKANSSRPRAMVSPAACEPSAVRPSRGGRQSAI